MVVHRIRLSLARPTDVFSGRAAAIQKRTSPGSELSLWAGCSWARATSCATRELAEGPIELLEISSEPPPGYQEKGLWADGRRSGKSPLRRHAFATRRQFGPLARTLHVLSMTALV